MHLNTLSAAVGATDDALDGRVPEASLKKGATMTRYRLLPNREEVQQVPLGRRTGLWNVALPYYECPFQAATQAAHLEQVWQVRWDIVNEESDDPREWHRVFRIYRETGALLDPGPLALA